MRKQFSFPQFCCASAIQETRQHEVPPKELQIWSTKYFLKSSNAK